MNIKKIALIGAGEIGSRHLQALGKCQFPVELFVVDPNSSSTELSQKRLKEVPANANIYSVQFLTSLDLLPHNLDLVIIATNASVRLEILKKLMATKKIQNLILEKVLFQSLSDLDQAFKLIQDSKVKAWVNCPKRTFPLYAFIKDKLKNSKSFQFSVTGTNWGLACNGIHFIDLVSFIHGNFNYQMSTETLDPVIQDSKRKGFIEFSGKLLCQFEQGPRLEMESISGSETKFQIKIMTDQLMMIIDEPKGLVEIQNVGSSEKQVTNFKPQFQSELTHDIAKQILFNENCQLPLISDSIISHRPFIKSLLTFYQKLQNAEAQTLPIT